MPRARADEAATPRGEPDRGLLDAIEGVIWQADAGDGPLRFSFVSGRAEALLGFPPRRWFDEPGFWESRIHPDDRERVRECLLAVARDGGRIELDYRAVTADGRTLWLRDRVHATAGASGTPGRLGGLLVDVSPHRLAEERLLASEARKGAILECALDCIVTIDHTGLILEFNPAAEHTFGYRRAEVLGRPMADLIVPAAHREAHRKGLARHLETGESRVLGRRIEITALRADGTEFPVELSITRVPGSMPPVFTGFLRDLTGRGSAEAELRSALSLLTATLESTADGILVVDPNGRIVSLNRRFATMWALPQEILESRDDERAIAFALDQLKEPEAFLAKVRELYAQPDAESVDRLELKDGRVFERYSIPQRIDGRSVGRVWSFRDVTSRLQAEAALHESEEQLRQSQKMDAIGRLAGGVAHDFNNLLTVILGYGERLQSQLIEGDPRRSAVEEIQNAAQRAAALTRQLLAFSRKQMLEPRELDLNQVLAGTGGLLRRLIGEDIQLDVRLDPRLSPIHADEHQMQQVIMNLAINARDAMPKGGRLTLATAEVAVDGGPGHGQPQLPGGRYVTLTVSDTGVGMDAETRARVFEPFFTTKELGKGTGLGLATVYGIVRQSGGDITVSSEPGRGAVFKVFLPRHEPREAAAAPAAGSAPPARGSETVLLVEDEPTVRELMRGSLERHGYRVLVAASGEQALTVAAGLPERLHLIVTDVVMPGLRGTDLVARLLAGHPRLRVLFISGYADDAPLREAVSQGHTAFLQKPFTREALVLKVREVLDARQTA